tara:strand:- start:124 stop:642 length:519 start_codon:yes stop_codon:yes gene_type:complete
MRTNFENLTDNELNNLVLSGSQELKNRSETKAKELAKTSPLLYSDGTLMKIKLSTNKEVNDFMYAFYYHNHEYFRECISKGVKKIVVQGEQVVSGVGIYYEKGKWKWGSESMQNSMKRRGFIKVLRSDWNTSCLDATPKLVNKILNNIYRTLENIKCVKEGRYDDRNFTPCR